MNEWKKATEESKVNIGLQGQLKTATAICVSQCLAGFSDHLYTTHCIQRKKESVLGETEQAIK